MIPEGPRSRAFKQQIAKLKSERSKDMKIRKWSTFVIAVTLFAAVVLFRPALDTSVRAQSQTAATPVKSREEGGIKMLGSDEASAMEAVGSMSEETLDKASVEAQARGGPVIGPIPLPLPGGLDYVANGVGTRNAGFGAIRLRGVPVGAVAVRAVLYWGVVTAPPAPPTATAVLQGTAVTGSLIGTAAEPCWNSAGVFAGYQANVLGLLAPGINADYSVAGLSSSVTTGSNPWAPFVNSLPLSEGASLVVVYSHSSIPTSASVIVTLGPRRFDNGTFDFTHFLRSPLANHTALKHTRLGADGQVGIPIPGSGLRSFAGITNEQTYIGQAFTGVFTQIKGIGAPLNQDSDWNGYDGDPLSKLWDTHTDDITGAIAAGSASYTVRYVAGLDCCVWLVHILGAR
jgi:hypothetical protein